MAGWWGIGAGPLRRIGVGAVATALMSAALVGCGAAPVPPTPEATIAPYIKAWNNADYKVMAALVRSPPADFASVQRRALADLGAPGATHTAGRLSVHGAAASVPLTTVVDVAGYGKVDLHSTLSLVLAQGRWRVSDWSSRVIDTALAPGDRFSVSATWPARASILGAGGVPLTGADVAVGIAGYLVTNPPAVQAALVGAGFDPATVAAALAAAAAHPKLFEPVATVSDAAFQQLKSSGNPAYSVPGTEFQRSGGRQAITANLAQYVVGTVGPVTAQQLTTLGAPYAAGDLVGQGGLEAVDERQLAGRPSITVAIRDKAGHPVKTVAKRAAVPGTPLSTTIAPGIQAAAEAAMSAVTQPAALVAVQTTTGNVLASVSGPINGAAKVAYNLAFSGEFPPGSSFKLVTSTALLHAGVTPSSPTTCPATLNVNGESFHNYQGEHQASLSFAQAFAESCNTAFIGLTGSNLHDQSLSTAAASYGLGVVPKLGLAAFGGSVKTATSPTQLAADSIGQGNVLASPLAMAALAAGIGGGVYHEPRLVTGSADDTAAPIPLDPAVDAALKLMMGQVVTSGTAAGAGLPAGTDAKTGTAQYGSANLNDAWLVGFYGDVAFAVVVHGVTGPGATVAGPLVAAFLKALPSGS